MTSSSDNGIIKENGVYRRSGNTGAFSHLPERMSKKHIRELAEKYDIDTSGLTINIDKNEELLKYALAGEAVPEHIGTITFFPNAFSSEEELMRTLVHEKVHVEQFRKHGAKFVQDNMNQFEDEAYATEEKYFSLWKDKGLL